MYAAYIRLGRSKGHPGRDSTRSDSGLAAANDAMTKKTANTHAGVDMAKAGRVRVKEGGEGGAGGAERASAAAN
jgi:hypothetical protein